MQKTVFLLDTCWSIRVNGYRLHNLLANGSEQKYNDMYVFVYLREKEEM